MSILEVKNLKKSYRTGFTLLNSTEVLKGLSFSIGEGTITGFLGGNGAGKTTTMKCILGLCFPDSGEIQFFGESNLKAEVRSKIGFLPERPYFYEYLTGREFLIFYGQLSTRLKKADLKQRIDFLLKKVDLEAAKDRYLRGYSKGMLQKIGLAQALIHDPELLILDEPMSGLDPDGRMAMTELIQETAAQGRSVFFSSHLLHDAQKICEKLVILSGGEVIYEGKTQEFLDNMKTGYEISFYSGESLVKELYYSSEEIQKRLYQLVQGKSKIVEVKQLRSTLEEAFVNVALRKKEAP